MNGGIFRWAIRCGPGSGEKDLPAMDDGTRRQKFNPAKGQIDRIKTLSLRKPLIGEPPWRRLASRGDFRALPFLPKTTTTTMTSLYELPLNTLSGEPVTLAAYRGQVLLIVNVASKCGLTPQYEGLERLHETYGERGLRVLGFPCNDFLGQEPGMPEKSGLFAPAITVCAFRCSRKCRSTRRIVTRFIAC